MNTTKNFFDAATLHRRTLKTIWEKYDAAMARLEQHRGSKYYEMQAKQAENERDEAISATQTATAESFRKIIGEMRENATNRPMATPTSEFLGLVQTLKLREHISRDELLQASRTLKGCPVCLAVLEELAEKNGYIGMHLAAESTDSVLKHIDSLETSAKKLLKLTKPNSHREQLAKASIYSPAYTPNATELLLVDRDFTDERELVSFLGNVECYEDFCSAVNV